MQVDCRELLWAMFLMRGEVIIEAMRKRVECKYGFVVNGESGGAMGDSISYHRKI